MNQLAQYLL